jgi:multiple sugar transport system ATP-binding protein
VAEVRFVGATRVFRGGWKPALHDVDLTVADGELLVLAGPSGSGKSTLLRMLAGLEPADRGRLFIGGEEVTRTAADKRGVAMVFQGFALFPHLSVYDNIAVPLTMRKVSAKTVGARVAEAAERCGLSGLLGARPDELDVEARQRATIARAIVGRPRVVCLDEPLAGSGAPPPLRARGPIAALQRELGLTMLYATCNTVDAGQIADRVAVLDDGVLHQVDVPRAVADRPASAAVARFFGDPPMNLVRVPLLDGKAALGSLVIELTPDQRAAVSGGEVLVGLRPRDLAIGAPAPSAGAPEGSGRIRAVAVLVKDTGQEYLVHARAEIAEREVDLVVRHADGAPPVRGEWIAVGAAVEQAHLFDAGTGLRLPDPER